eukprot:481835_1
MGLLQTACDTKVNGFITNEIEYCYTFIPHSVSTVTFSNCESDFDTTLFVYNKNSEEISQPYCDAGDDCGGCGLNEEFSIPQMSPNETYYILIDSLSSFGGGSYTIDVQCFDENIFDIPQSTSTIICPYTQGIISCNTKVNGIITNGAEYCYTFIPHYVSTVAVVIQLMCN